MLLNGRDCASDFVKAFWIWKCLNRCATTKYWSENTVKFVVSRPSRAIRSTDPGEIRHGRVHRGPLPRAKFGPDR